MNDKEKIVDRVRKLLAMAADVSSPNEAAIAARRARALMDKYQISSTDLEEDNEYQENLAGGFYKFMPTWRNILACAVAKYNDCNGAMARDGKRWSVKFQGLDTDVALATHMYLFLIEANTRLCKQFMLEYHEGANKPSLMDSFKKGCASELCTILREMIKEREKNHVGAKGQSLVLVKQALVEQHFGKPKYSEKAADIADSHAHAQGRVAARTVNIGNHVAGPEQRKRVRG